MSASTLRAFKHVNSSSKSFGTCSCEGRPLCAELVDGRDALVRRHLLPEVAVSRAFFGERRALPAPQFHLVIISPADPDARECSARRTAASYMSTGSVAASYHGHPRATHDADLVIDPTTAQLDGLVTGLEAAGFYVDLDSAHEALRRRAQFTAIDTRYGCKIDLIVRRDRPFSQAEFDRPVTDLTFGRAISIVRPEYGVSGLRRAARDL